MSENLSTFKRLLSQALPIVDALDKECMEAQNRAREYKDLLATRATQLESRTTDWEVAKARADRSDEKVASMTTGMAELEKECISLRTKLNRLEANHYVTIGQLNRAKETLGQILGLTDEMEEMVGAITTIKGMNDAITAWTNRLRSIVTRRLSDE